MNEQELEKIHQEILEFKLKCAKDWDCNTTEIKNQYLFNDNQRRIIIENILKIFNIRLSLDKLYENYYNDKPHKKLKQYFKFRQLNTNNPWALCFQRELILPESLLKEIYSEL